MEYGLDTIHFSFYMYASIHVYTRMMTSNLSFKALVHALDMCTTVCRHTGACQESTPNLDYVHVNWKPRTAE